MNQKLANGRMNQYRLFIFGIALLGCFNSCMALTEDSQKTIQFRADSADINQSTHLGVYLGNVELDQGSTHIRAAQAQTETNQKNQLIKAVIKGNNDGTAHFWTLTATNKAPLHAYADTIQYYPEQHVIELIGHARVEQGNDSFSAPQITYNIATQHVVSKSAKNERTMIIIHPEKQS